MDKTPHNPLQGERADMVLSLDGTDERISIIVVHNDRPEYLNICLQTLLVTSVNNNFEVIVVDNGSKDIKSQTFLDQLESDGIKVIRNDENLYWSKAANQGAKAADKNSKYLLFMHHDINILNPLWMDVLVNVAEKNKSGLVGFYMSSYKVPGNDQKIEFVDECCMLVSRECWRECGPFIEDLPQIGAPFIFNLTASGKGYSPQAVKNQFVWHYQTVAISLNDFERLAEQAQAALPKYLMQLQKANAS